MSEKPKFTKYERMLAREVIAGISGRHTRAEDIAEPTTSLGTAAGIWIGILGVCFMAGAGYWGFLYSRQTDQVEVVSTPAIRGDATNDRTYERSSNGAAAPAPPTPSVQSSLPQRTPAQTQSMPTTIPRMAVTPRVDPLKVEAELKQNHAAVAHEAIKQKLRYETRFGSGNVSVYQIEIMDSETSSVRGWPRYRTEGKAGIAYYDSRGEFKRTTRGFEVLTEDKTGTIRAVDVTVK